MSDVGRIHDLLVVAGELDLTSVARAFTDVFASDGATVFVVGDSDLTVGGAYPGNVAAASRLRIPFGYGVVGLVAQNGNSVTIVDDAPRNPDHRELLGIDKGQRVSRLCVPAHGMGRAILGVVSVYRMDRHRFSADDLARAQRLADLVGLRLYAEGLRGAVREQAAQRDELIAQAISAQEAERRRIANDLHDGVTQLLASLSFQLSAAHTGLRTAVRRIAGHGGPTDPLIDSTLAEIAEAKRLAALAYEETRAAILGLHSLLLDDLGLVAALESLCRSVPQIEVEFRSDRPDEFDALPNHAAGALFRIAQEALNNAVKHSRADAATMSLSRVGDATVLCVADDGAGFDVRSVRQRPPTSTGEHFGLDSIVERSALIGATLRIDSVEGSGTTVIVELPLHQLENKR